MSETEAADAAEEFTDELDADIWADEPAGPSLVSKMLAEVAGTFILVLSAWDLFGTLPLPLGVAGHEGSTVLVALNGMRLLSKRAWTRKP